MMNYKSTEEYKMISKTRKNFSKEKKTINIRNNFFQKIYYLSVIEIENDHNLKFLSFKFFKLSALIFSSVNQTH